MLIDVCAWRIPAENHEKLLQAWREVMDYQKAHPKKVHYTRSPFFTLTEEGSSEETWMFIDEYEDRKACDKMMKAFQEDPDLVKLKKEWGPQWHSMIVPGSRKSELWTEAES